MKTVKEYVKEIPFEDKLEMIENWKEFNKKGSIDDCILRKYAKEYDSSRIFPSIAQDIMFDIFEEFAMKYLEDKKSNNNSIEEKFFKFLKDNNVYDEYFSNLDEIWEEFKEIYEPTTWFVNGFLWGNEYEEWEILDEKWNKLLKG